MMRCVCDWVWDEEVGVTVGCVMRRWVDCGVCDEEVCVCDCGCVMRRWV